MSRDQEFMKHLFLTSSFVLCLLALATTSLRAQDELHQTYPLSANGTVSIQNVSGYIRITSWNENRVQVDAVKRGDREEFSQVEIRVADSPDRLEITTVYPRNFGRGRNRVEVNYDVKVPRSAVLAPITSTSGAITITEPGARLNARSTSGDVVVRGSRGEVNIASTSGDVGISEAEANVTAHSTSGDLTATDIRADLTAHATSGSLHIERVRGRLQAQSISGRVSVKDIGGDATLQSISDSVQAENIQGRLNVNAVSADVTLRNVQQGARINSVSGTITITNTKGLIEAKTTSGDINVSEVEAREILLNTHSGRITYTGTIFDDGRYAFESFNGAILLTIPAAANFSLAVTTFNGSIETDFPITIPAGTTQTSRPRRLQGTYGKSNGAEIKVGGFNADIKLKKQ
jgi:DUF4097 and DUF4098 domain-containing protein YvlB